MWLQLELLEYLELLDDGYVLSRLSSTDTVANVVSDELALLLRTLTLPADQLEHYKSKAKPPKPGFGPAEGAIFAKAVQVKQAQYATTIAQDEKLLAQLAQSGAPGLSEESARRYAMAIQVRLGEKQILHNLFAVLNDYLVSSGGSAQKRAAYDDNDDSRMSKAQRS